MDTEQIILESNAIRAKMATIARDSMLQCNGVIIEKALEHGNKEYPFNRVQAIRAYRAMYFIAFMDVPDLMVSKKAIEHGMLMSKLTDKRGVPLSDLA